MDDREVSELAERVRAGGAAKYHQKNAEQSKLFARERIRLLLDTESFVEDGLLANSLAEVSCDWNRYATRHAFLSVSSKNPIALRVTTNG